MNQATTWTSKVTYSGELRTSCEHVKSGNSIITDAPTDNHGKGEAFSPTDLVATALANCMVTVMGIKARSKGLHIEGTKAHIQKVMASDPRRISTIKVVLDMKSKESLSSDDKKLLEKTAIHCPVAKSIHPDIIQDITFNW